MRICIWTGTDTQVCGTLTEKNKVDERVNCAGHRRPIQNTSGLEVRAGGLRCVDPSCAQEVQVCRRALFLRGRRSLTLALEARWDQSLQFTWISFVVLVLCLDVVDSMENDDCSQIVCTGVVGNSPGASFGAAALASERPIHGARLGLVINSTLTACCQDLQVHHHTTLVTRHTKLCCRSLFDTSTTSSIEQHGPTSNSQQQCKTSSKLVQSMQQKMRLDTPLNKLARL